MAVIWTPGGVFTPAGYGKEAELENTILKVQRDLFGESRVYLDIKRKLGRNIPDGYLIDLSGHKPKLYFVENELASHDPLRHIAMQLLEFSLAFDTEPRIILKNILLDALNGNSDVKMLCESYSSARGYRGLDHLLDELVYGSPFAALVIIDEIPEKLESVLAKKFKFAVEILELARYVDTHGQYIYRFEPFLAEITESRSYNNEHSQPLDVEEVDTVIVPAREDGFNNTFVRENRWYSIRLNGIMRPQIKWVAVYQVAPISAITHVAPVASIESWEDSDKFVLNFSEPAHAINPIGRGERLKHLQNIKYTTYKRLQVAKTLDDL